MDAPAERENRALKKILIALTVLLTLLCGCDRQSDNPEQSPRMRIQFDWLPEPEFGGFYAARMGNEFEKRGLKVELHAGAAGTPVIQMVASGQAELGVSGADDLLIALDHGIDLVPVYASFKESPLGLMLHADRQYAEPSQLFREGTLAMIPGSTPLRFLERKFPFAGVKLVPVGSSLASFLSDPLFAQLCFITSEPVEAEAAGAKVKVLLFKELGYNPYTGVLFTRRQFFEQHREEIARLVEALKGGWISYQSNPEPAIAEMHRLNPTMTIETFRKSTQIQEAYLWGGSREGAGLMTDVRWKELATTLKDLGLIREIPTVNLGSAQGQ